ncbi:MAG TPA: O-acetyl-ADP-ribose deacetylase [Bacteroidetes bacterium]|nr:O-acetyl-ADP-ribose deacetylase [Bacteroidota bacterium]
MERIKITKGDITKIAVDAIVNAANSSLLGGGGVDGAIHRAGGPAILAACRIIREKQGGCPTGQAVITTAGRLPARHIIHTVGPIWDAASEPEMKKLLADCYRNSLQLALDHQLKTVAFPNISTGIYGFPKNIAATVAIRSVREFLQNDHFIEQVIFVCFDDENYQIYNALLK